MHLSFLLLPLAATLVRAGRHYKKAPCKIKESIHGPPHGWHKHGPAPPDHFLELKIALPHPYFHILEDHLLEVSNPEHERYGDYLSKEETEALMAPHPETIDVVSKWLSSYGIEEEHLYRSSAQDWITIRVPVVLAEEMLDTKYDIYIHSDGDSIIRTTSYSLPEDLHEHVEVIQPTTMFSRIKALRSTLHWSSSDPSPSPMKPQNGTITGPAGNQVDAKCNQTITVDCLRQIYNTVGYAPSTNNGNKIAVTGYLEQYANNKDLQQFFELQNPAAYGSNYTFVSINGGLNNQTYAAAGIEANLDTQFAFGLTYPTPGIFYSTGGSPPYIPDTKTSSDTNEPYIDWLNYLTSQQYLPQTISTSYGDDEQTVPYPYASRVCSDLASLGVRGVSLLFSSGDSGVGDGDPDPTSQQCFSNDGTNKIKFIPVFPASCPYVTAVGATQQIPEIGAFFSGGGFSDYFPRPDYQHAAVSRYLDALAPGTYHGLYNSTGRAYPDVAAQGVHFEIVYKGEPRSNVSGTSCASPTFASIVSMLNDARLSAGKSPLGFLNPFLYQIGYAGLNDITAGNNPGCGTQGFNTSVGWDPVTGLGTPNFEKLLKLVMDDC